MEHLRILFFVIVISFGCLASQAYNRPESYNYQRGVEALQNKNYSEALDYLNRDLNENPKNGYSYSWIAMLRLEKKEYGKALTAANQALKYLPKKDTEYVLFGLTTRAKVYLALGDTIKAMDDYTTAIRTDPKNTNLRDDRAQIYYEQKKYDLAYAEFKKMIELDPGNVLGYMGLGRNYNDQKRWEDAIKQFDYVTKLASDYSSGYAFRAEAYLGLENWDKATDDIISAMSLDWDRKAVSLMANTIKEPALTILLSKIKIKSAKSPGDAMWPYLTGLILEENKRYQKAIQAYAEANNIEVSDVTYRHIAMCHIEMGNYNQAMDNINRALNIDSTDINNKIYKADILYDLGEAERAIAMWDEILKECPDYDWGYYRRGWYKELVGDLDGALDDLSMSIVLDPTYAYAYSTRCDVYLKQGKRDLAEADSKKVIELEKDSTEYECIFYAYQVLGQYDKAIETLNIVLSRDTTEAGNYYDAACLYSRMQDKANALKYMEQALELGYCRFAHFELDSYLDFIRDSEEYKQLIERYKSQQEQVAPIVTTDESIELKTGEVPFVKEGGICKVKCQINGLPLHFVFDTGASDVTISLVEANFMMKNGYLSDNDIIGSERYVDANGEISVGTVINLKSVDFGDFNLKNVRASVVRNQKAPLLLGQSVLARLGRIEIDNRSQVLRISNPGDSHY